MNIAVLSGKGGTGKTFVSVNLASVIPNSLYIDCDVEEPNGHLFFKSEVLDREMVYNLLPHFDGDKCIGCRACVDFCRFHALAFVKGKPFLFQEVCHSCGGCALLCKEGAITEEKHLVGELQSRQWNDTKVLSGILNIGEESGIPIIDRLLSKITSTPTIIDCPPGSACSVMESISKADYCILVAEPTLFGVHNFEMVYQLVQILQKPFGVIINKYDKPNNPMDIFCEKERIPILARIPFQPELAEQTAKGQIVVETNSTIRELFLELYEQIQKEVTP